MDEKLLKDALKTVMEQDIEAIEKSMKNSSDHLFGDEFENKMEALIQHTDRRYISIGKHMFRKATMIAAVAVMIFLCVGFSPIGKAVWDYCATIFQKEEFGNISMGLGRAAYDGENVHFLVHESSGNVIYSYNVVSGELDSIYIQDETSVRVNMFAQDEFIYYGSIGENAGLKRISKDGTTVEQVLEHGNGFQEIYMDGKNAYILESIEGNLVVKNLETGEDNEIFSCVLSYFVDEEKVYVIARENDIPYLFIADKEALKFEKQTLTFTPIAIYVANGEMYLAQQGDYQIIRISNSEENKLPIFGTYYQVLGDKIIYLDVNTFVESCFELTSYDLATGQKKIISKNVFDFALLGDDYIYIQCNTTPNHEFYLYDYKELTRIY